MSTLSARQPAERKRSITPGKNTSPHSGKCSRNSSLNRTKMETPCESAFKDLEDAECEFQPVNSNCDEKPEENQEENKEEQTPQVKENEVPQENPIKRPITSAVKAHFSSIPLPMIAPKKATNRLKSIKSGNAAARMYVPVTKNNVSNNRHTLEIQFLNKSKRLSQLKKELLETQKPTLELYQNLLHIKKKLNELGKCVQVEDMKWISFDEMQRGAEKKSKEEGAGELGGDSEKIRQRIEKAKKTFENIPRTLAEVCRNLLSRRAAIVELLEAVTKQEVDSDMVTEKVTSLKEEGGELQKSLEVVIDENEQAMKELLMSWQRLSAPGDGGDESRVELENQLKARNRLVEECQHTIAELQRELDERKSSYDKVSVELENAIKKQEEKVKKLESDIESEKRINTDYKNRNVTNSQTIKSLKNKIAELESRCKEQELKNSDMSKKLSHAQDQFKVKEGMWQKDREELSKNLRHHEGLLQKLTDDRNHFETRYKNTEKLSGKQEKKLTTELETANQSILELKEQIAVLEREKQETQNRCAGMEQFIKKMSDKNMEAMEYVQSKIDWGKSPYCTEAAVLTEVLSLRVEIRDYEDKVKILEEEINNLNNKNNALQQEIIEAKMTREKADGPMNRYQLLLEESEKKLSEKCRQVNTLKVEVRQLKVRQNAIEEEHGSCPTTELMKLLNEGKSKMGDLIRRSMENDKKIHEYEVTVEKQRKQMNEMENLLKMRDGLMGVMKSKKDELQFEKETLTRYSNEMRAIVFGIKLELANKVEQVQDLQEKLDSKERACCRLEKKIAELEEHLTLSNESRFKLQKLLPTKAQRSALHGSLGGTTDEPLPLDYIKTGLANYQPQLVSKTLYGMSLKHIYSIRARIDELNTMKTPIVEDIHHSDSRNVLEKMLQVKARRCEILQQRADQSHDDLHHFLKMLTPANGNNSLRESHSFSSGGSFAAYEKYTPIPDKRNSSINIKGLTATKSQHESLHCSPRVSNSSHTLTELSKTIDNLKRGLKTMEDKMNSDPLIPDKLNEPSTSDTELNSTSISETTMKNNPSKNNYVTDG